MQPVIAGELRPVGRVGVRAGAGDPGDRELAARQERGGRRNDQRSAREALAAAVDRRLRVHR